MKLRKDWNRAVRSCSTAALLAGILIGLTPRLAAQESYLQPGQPDGIALLPTPPAPDSKEEAADLASARAVFNGRTPAEEAHAKTTSTLAFSLFLSGNGLSYETNKLPKTAALMQKVKKEIGSSIDTVKNHWKRKRPYQLDERLSLGAPEPSFGYPSGHSTRGTVYALVLAEVFPGRKDEILAMGREIGWDRVIIGKHFPTDIYAGRFLGAVIFRQLQASSAFQRDLAEAKAEARKLNLAPATAGAN